MAGKEIKVSCYLLNPGAENKSCLELTEEDYTPWGDVPEEKKRTWMAAASDRIGRSLSAYLRQHPEELPAVMGN